jgi:hypothetical protein
MPALDDAPRPRSPLCKIDWVQDELPLEQVELYWDFQRNKLLFRQVGFYYKLERILFILSVRN